MQCSHCGSLDLKVIDSRNIGDGIRRRRECLGCGSRFTTLERPQNRNFYVVKKDSRREEFNRDKLLGGIRRACEKRPLNIGTIDKIVETIEADLYSLGKTEIASSVIGDMVIDNLKELDHIAYIRFASVYREFADISALKQAVDTLVDTRGKTPLDGQLALLTNDQLKSIGKLQRRRGK